MQAGWNLIAGLEPENIIRCVSEMFAKSASSLSWPDLYGSGDAGEKIVNELLKWEKEQSKQI